MNASQLDPSTEMAFSVFDWWSFPLLEICYNINEVEDGVIAMEIFNIKLSTVYVMGQQWCSASRAAMWQVLNWWC